MKLSVVIPTYKRPLGLLRVLQSLQQQTLTDFETVVVDNATNAGVARRVMEFTESTGLGVRYVPEPRLGATNARHAGARVSHGDLLVYFDDDETVDPRTLEAYAKAFAERPEMAAAGGPIRAQWESPPPEWLLSLIGPAKVVPLLGLCEAYGEFRLESKGFLLSGNMAIRREVLFKVGGFNPDYVGDILMGDGEVGLYKKLWEHRMMIGYLPEALVYHHIPAERMNVKYLCRRAANEGASDMYSLFHEGMADRFRLFEHAATIVAANVKGWAAARVLRGRTDARSIAIQIQAARTQAQLKWLVRLIVNRDLQTFVVKKDWLNDAHTSEPPSLSAT